MAHVKPRHKHDCDCCVFLGHYDKGETQYDLYYCPQPAMPESTLIARFGPDGDYLSGMVFGWGEDQHHPLVVARMAAEEHELECYRHKYRPRPDRIPPIKLPSLLGCVVMPETGIQMIVPKSLKEAMAELFGVKFPKS